MKYLFRCLLMFLFVSHAPAVQAQIIETTYNWGSFDHSCWKVQPNEYGYVMVGSKFFEPNNTSLYVQGFDHQGKSLFLKSHIASGFSNLFVFWKSFVLSHDKSKIFAVSSGSQSGQKAYALLTDSEGRKIWDRVSDLPNGITFGGVTNAKNGGWVAVGSSNFYDLAVVKFDPQGRIEWTKIIPISGFGWSIVASWDGGYFIGSTGSRITKIDHSGNLEWSTAVVLPPSPSGAYTYTEFEELFEYILPAGGISLPVGIILTGSCFSNSHSGAYTAMINHGGTVKWSMVHAPQNTALAGTPVSWISNAILEGPYVTTSWRTGPVSSGGTMHYARQVFYNGAVAESGSLDNTIPVQEAFLIKSKDKYIVGGTRGGYSAAYSYINDQLSPWWLEGFRRSEGENLPIAEASRITETFVRVNFNNTKPIYKYHPASRVFNSEMQVFPNPSTGLVKVGGRIEHGALLRVTDITGRIVLEKQIRPGEAQVELDLKNQGKGLYNVEMIGSDHIISQKIILQ